MRWKIQNLRADWSPRVRGVPVGYTITRTPCAFVNTADLDGLVSIYDREGYTVQVMGEAPACNVTCSCGNPYNKDGTVIRLTWREHELTFFRLARLIE